MIEKILEDREERYHFVLDLIDQYKLPVICGKVNYPGTDKNTDIAKGIFHILKDRLNLAFKEYTVFSKTMTGYDGESLILVVNMDKLEAKRIGTSIEEESRLGRLFDIDIYIEGGRSVSRSELGLPSRKCIICGEDPRICRKLDRHTTSDILKEIENIYEQIEF